MISRGGVVRVLAAAALLLLLTCACSPFGKSKAEVTPSGSPSPPTLAQASGALDAQVEMPPGFPSDVPIYPKARLTAWANFTSTGEVSWGMEWETSDPMAKVQAFYAGKFSQGDWTISFSATSYDGFNATIARKSNPQAKGAVGADSSSGVTNISLYLSQPA